MRLWLPIVLALCASLASGEDLQGSAAAAGPERPETASRGRVVGVVADEADRADRVVGLPDEEAKAS